MKKTLTLILAVLLLFAAVPAFADGAMTDKEIRFGSFDFGDTFADIRSSHYMININFQRGLYNPRSLADAVNFVADWQMVSKTAPVCFSSEPDEVSTAAGHRCFTSLWFVYPVENGASVINEAEAVFYAGEYNFWSEEESSRDIFEDLERKLRQLYGEPFMTGDSIDAVFGKLELSKEFQNSYQELSAQFAPTYVVWRSAANNTVIVLKFFRQDGMFESTKLLYISPDTAAPFTQLETNSGNSGNSSNSMEGL